MIQDRETLTVEFKSDRDCLSDKDLLDAVVCLANTEGGSLFVGAEDDGTPTGLHARRAGNVEGLCAHVCAAGGRRHHG